MIKSEKGQYFPAVDGLRALAVLSVLLFHINGIVPSGFVGVDVFFVISGFVVTLASNSLPKQELSSFLLTFYGRRLQRIFPAAIFCLLITFLLMVLFIPVAPDGRLTESNTKTGLAAFFGLGNIVLSQSLGDYWSPRTELNPFTHTWSLGVEEQFYFTFPILVYLWLAKRNIIGPILIILLCAVSVVAAVQTSGSGPFAFYSLVTRFWELGIGVVLALTSRHWMPIAERNVRGSSLVGGLGLIGISAALFISDSHAFPWPWALLPVVATALLLISVASIVPTNPVVKILGSKPFVWVGLRSFSLYLWHWPVVVLMRWTTGLETVPQIIFAILASTALTMLSFSLIETPIRSSAFLRTIGRARLVSGFVAMVCVAALLAGALAFNRANLTLSATSHPTIWRWDGTLTGDDPKCRSKRSFQPFVGGRILSIEPSENCKIDRRTMYVAGDSHAGAYTAMLDLYARASGRRVLVYSLPGCGVYDLRRTTTAVSKGCANFVSSVMKEIAGSAEQGDLLFLPGLRLPRYSDQWGPVKAVQAGALDAAQRTAIVGEAIAGLGPLAKAGVNVVFEAPKPIFRAPLFRCSDSFNHSNPVCEPGFQVDRSDIDALRKPVLETIGSIINALPGVSTWDPIDALCSQQTCPARRDGKPVFFDGDHLSGFGNELLFPKFFEYMTNISSKL